MTFLYDADQVHSVCARAMRKLDSGNMIIVNAQINLQSLSLSKTFAVCFNPL